jgi:hypothetical protein
MTWFPAGTHLAGTRQCAQTNKIMLLPNLRRVKCGLTHFFAWPIVSKWWLQVQLSKHGLGGKKICFNWKASVAEVKTKLEEVYPKLENGRGFEIMRRGSEQVNDVMIIQPPRSGYSVPFLRDAAGLGQAIAFIRPIQINLDIQAVPVMESSEVL